MRNDNRFNVQSFNSPLFVLKVHVTQKHTARCSEKLYDSPRKKTNSIIIVGTITAIMSIPIDS